MKHTFQHRIDQLEADAEHIERTYTESLRQIRAEVNRLKAVDSLVTTSKKEEKTT